MKTTSKLYSAVVLLLISMSMMVCVSYAWFTLSDAPAISGIKVSIGVDTSIRIAPNITETVDDVVVNYPGEFVHTAFLEPDENALLAPVSTADGINWFIPVTDELGNMTSAFVHDSTYEHANSSDGGYVMLDFWLVSPLDQVVVRLCTGDEDEIGTYAVQLPESVKNYTNESGYVLDDSYSTLASSVRVGFLVNDQIVEASDPITAYAHSYDYQNDYKSLRGVYDSSSLSKFVIYEPNGTVHPNEGHSVVMNEDGFETVLLKNGDYWITRPICLDENNNVSYADIADRLIVQTESGWLKNTDGSLKINEMYQAYLRNSSNPTLNDFYENTIGGTYLQYVYAGLLVDNAYDLYMGAHPDYASEDEISVMEKTNAIVDSHIVVLKKNVPQRIRMFVWMEGQDVDCNSKAADHTIAIRLELAGSTGA